MTIVVQFENDNWYAEGVAIMCDELYGHPIMMKALEQIAAEWGFDNLTECEREQDYDELHRQVTAGP